MLRICGGFVPEGLGTKPGSNPSLKKMGAYLQHSTVFFPMTEFYPKQYFILLLNLEIVMLLKSCFQHALIFVLHPSQDQ
jgi:hypothetical protein